MATENFSIFVPLIIITMKIVISPAKTINETSPLPTERYSSAIFTKEIAEVHAALQPLSPQKLSALMSISPKLA